MMAVLYLNRITLLVSVVATFSLSAMVKPPQPPKLSQKSKASWNSLPTDVKKYMMQFIASSKVYEVTQTMKVLNATDKSCHELIQSESVVYSILAHMPYYDNQYMLLKCLRRWCFPIWNIYVNCFYLYRKQDCLVDGEALYIAVNQNNTAQVRRLLCKKNINLNWNQEVNRSPLMAALQNGNLEIIKLLLDAGTDPETDPDTDNKRPLFTAALSESKEMVELLLAAGANPNINHLFNLANGDPIPEIHSLIRTAQKKRKKRMRLLCGKKPDGCAIA